MTELAGERPQAVSVRLDKWLWAARFYKTRALAIQAIDSGKVTVNGERAKPARSLKPGDAVTVRKGPYRFDIVVQALSLARGPASEAHKLYQETSESLAAREALAAQLRDVPQPASKGRPTKKARRLIHRFTEG